MREPEPTQARKRPETKRNAHINFVNAVIDNVEQAFKDWKDGKLDA